jgi:hypothetical protein
VVEPRKQVHPDLENTPVGEVRVSARASDPRGGKGQEPGVEGLEPECRRTSSPTACALSQKAKSSLICTDQSDPTLPTPCTQKRPARERGHTHFTRRWRRCVPSASGW